MTHTASVSDTIMRRVYRVYVLRRAAAVAGAGALYMIALWGVGREVWVAKVIENMPALTDVPAVSLFLARAFQHTDLAVQLLVLIALGAMLWLAHAMARIASLRPLATA